MNLPSARLPYTLISRPVQLRTELMLRSKIHARRHPHVKSYGSSQVIVYAPANDLHGNFYTPAYSAILARPEWSRRFNKVHSQGRSLPKSQLDPLRKWRELDSSMSSDALLMNIFCTPGVTELAHLRNTMGIDLCTIPTFGWKARVPLINGRVDRTEVDMRWGDLLVEAKLTESDFQCREAPAVESYRDLGAVFDLDALPRVPIRTQRRREAIEFPEVFTQEWEAPNEDASEVAQAFRAQIEKEADDAHPWQPGYAGYQIIRNVLAAHATGMRFCVMIDQRRPDLLEAWFEVMSAIKITDLRVRCKVLTWQELVPYLPTALADFLDLKYGIVAPGTTPFPIGELDPAL